MKSLLHKAFLLLIILPQTASAQIQSQADLLKVLTTNSKSGPGYEVELLKNNERYVTADLWGKLIEQASRDYYYGNPNKAFEVYRVAVAVALQLKDKRLLATTYNYAGRAHSGMGRIQQAIDSYFQSLAAFEDAGLRRDVIHILGDLGALYLNQEDYEKARDYSERSIALAQELRNSNLEAGAWPDQYGIARSLANLGAIDEAQGNYSRALARLQESLALYRQINSVGTTYLSNIARIVTGIGYIHGVLGDNARALSHMDEALKTLKSSTDRSTAPHILNVMGILYLEQEDYSNARKYLSESLQLYTLHNNALNAARVRVNIGVLYRSEGDYDEALKYFHEALQETQNIGVVLAAEQNIGAAYRAKGDYVRASEWLNKSLARAKQIGSPVRVVESLWRQAQVRYGVGDYPGAINLAGEALNLAQRHRIIKHSYLVLTTLGSAHRAAKNYEQAYDALRRAIEIVEQLRDGAAGGDEGRRKFLENSLAPYHEMFLLLLEQNRVGEAFEYAERAKGRVLIDVLRGGKENINTNMTAAERGREQELDRRLAGLNNLLTRENLKEDPDSTRVDDLVLRIDEARAAHETFLTGLYAAHPELRRVRGDLAPVTLGHLPDIISDDKLAVLEYVVTEEGVYLIVLTTRTDLPGGEKSQVDLRAYRIAATTPEIVKRVSEFRTRIADHQIIPDRAYNALYDLLLKPAEAQLAGKQTLCVIPDGALWELPFQALRKGAKFLVEEYSLFYVPSLGVLREMKQRGRGGDRKDAAPRTLLAFGNPSLGAETMEKVALIRSGKKLAPLPEAEAEVRTIARLFDAGRSRVYIGLDALEGRAKSESGTHDVLHFATHALVDDRSPMYSHLVLSQQDGGSSGDDGLLEAREIMNLDLRADLVVLSACETARGRVSAGEGMIGMTWAFFVAGAPATVASLWNVESAGTSQLMIEFHRRLAESAHGGTSVLKKAEALRKAQLTLLTSEHFDHPFYWSGFSLFGDPR